MDERAQLLCEPHADRRPIIPFGLGLRQVPAKRLNLRDDGTESGRSRVIAALGENQEAIPTLRRLVKPGA